jgi:hypothetical protein
VAKLLSKIACQLYCVSLGQYVRLARRGVQRGWLTCSPDLGSPRALEIWLDSRFPPAIMALQTTGWDNRLDWRVGHYTARSHALPISLSTRALLIWIAHMHPNLGGSTFSPSFYGYNGTSDHLAGGIRR